MVVVFVFLAGLIWWTRPDPNGQPSVATQSAEGDVKTVEPMGELALARSGANQSDAEPSAERSQGPLQADPSRSVAALGTHRTKAGRSRRWPPGKAEYIPPPEESREDREAFDGLDSNEDLASRPGANRLARRYEETADDAQPGGGAPAPRGRILELSPDDSHREGDRR